MVVWHLGWIDLDLDSFLAGWLLGIVATYHQSRMVEHLNLESEPTKLIWDTLYLI